MLFHRRFNTPKEKSFVSNVVLKFNSCLLNNHIKTVMENLEGDKIIINQLRTKLRQCESIH